MSPGDRVRCVNVNGFNGRAFDGYSQFPTLNGEYVVREARASHTKARHPVILLFGIKNPPAPLALTASDFDIRGGFDDFDDRGPEPRTVEPGFGAWRFAKVVEEPKQVIVKDELVVLSKEPIAAFIERREREDAP